MTNRSAMLPAAAFSALFAAACTDSSTSSPKSAPPVQTGPHGVIGMIQGRVEGDSMVATFVPSANLPSGVSANIIGSSAMAHITGKFDSIHTTGANKTWYFHVKLQNLLAFPIGSNYGQAAPPDTSGLFIAFFSAPVVTLPVACVGCVVTVRNQMGTGNFTNMAEKYWWYRSRPAAAPGVSGSDTTTNTPQWQFRATPNSAPNIVTAFTFSLEVSAAFPPADGQSTWLTSYDGTADSLPDTQASPPWRAFAAPNTQTLGTEAFVSGSSLRLATTLPTTSIYFARHDSLGPMPAEMDVRARVKTATAAAAAGNDLQAVFGFAEPSGGKQVFVGLWGNGVSFVSFDETTGLWSQIGSICGPNPFGGCPTTTTYRIYRLRKISQTSVALCVNAVQRLTLPYAGLQGTTASFTTSSAVFGMPPHTALSVDSARYTSTAYTIGTDGGGC